MKRTLRIAEPCSQRWESMRGEGARRLCEACDKHVLELSSLTAAEAEARLASAPPGSLCVAVDHDEAGVIQWKPGGAAARAVMTLAVGASLAMAGCKPTEDARPTPAPERAPMSAQLPLPLTASALPPFVPAQEVEAVEPAASAQAAPVSPGKHPGKTTRTIGCACVASDPLCSCL